MATRDVELEHWPDKEPKEQESRTPSRASSTTSSSHAHGLPGTSLGDTHYHYLTFEVQLPVPAHHITDFPAPDLAEYGSPFDWPESRKSFIIWLSCIATTLTAYSAGSYAPGIEQMSQYWHIGRVATTVGITTFTAGFAVAPMVLAPFSEINGRRPVFVIAGYLFVICNLCCGVTRSYPGMLLARFFGGCASSVFSTMVGGVVADIYQAKDRNTPMTLFTGAALFGTGLGPLVSGFIAQNTSWRWIFYLHTILTAILMVFITFFFRETRGNVLLSRKAKKLNKWYQAREDAGHYGFLMPVEGKEGKFTTQQIRWKVKSDEERGSIFEMIRTSLSRPFVLLFTEPVVFFFSLWISFSWAVLYCTFSAVPYIFTTVYHFSLQESDAVFAAISIAAILATVTSIYQDRVLPMPKRFTGTPEARLIFTGFQSAFLPIGLFWLGWTSFPSIHWIVPALAVGAATLGIFAIYLAVFNYLADCYHRYASSAIAAQSFCRNLIGGAFPLFTRMSIWHGPTIVETDVT